MSSSRGRCGSALPAPRRSRPPPVGVAVFRADSWMTRRCGGSVSRQRGHAPILHSPPPSLSLFHTAMVSPAEKTSTALLPFISSRTVKL